MSSQGGYLVCLTHKAILSGGISSYHLLERRSRRLPLVARSTLAAEGQAAAEAADCLHFVIMFWKALLDPTDPTYRITSNERCFLWENESLFVIDAKCLYDILHREELYVSSASDKRTCLEALVTRDKLKEVGGSARWVSSERQYADGLTKDSATQLLADRLTHTSTRLRPTRPTRQAGRRTLPKGRGALISSRGPRLLRLVLQLLPRGHRGPRYLQPPQGDRCLRDRRLPVCDHPGDPPAGLLASVDVMETTAVP